ncbi:hypothetical protein [Streptomyces sp. NPDC001985]|uniref:hypothetical protein n=1 Tax=Streptomyces sp. NPDC001985 TaxID=3154406 RepID=UPI0033311E36
MALGLSEVSCDVVGELGRDSPDASEARGVFSRDILHFFRSVAARRRRPPDSR